MLFWIKRSAGELFAALVVTLDNKIENALQKWLAGEQLAALVQLQNDKNSRERHEQLAGEQLAALVQLQNVIRSPQDTHRLSEVAHIDRGDFQPLAKLAVSVSIPSWIFLEIASDVTADDKVSGSFWVVTIVGRIAAI